MIGATVDGYIDYLKDDVRMRGTFVPLYGLNNMFGQIPMFGMFLGGGSKEGLVGVTYEVVGPPSAPVLRVNPDLGRGARAAAQVLRIPERQRAAPRQQPPSISQPGRPILHRQRFPRLTAIRFVKSDDRAQEHKVDRGGNRSRFLCAVRPAERAPAAQPLQRLEQHVPLAAERKLDHAFRRQIAPA